MNADVSELFNQTLNDLEQTLGEFTPTHIQPQLDGAVGRDAPFLLSCYVEWQKLSAYQELIGALNGQDDVRTTAEALEVPTGSTTAAAAAADNGQVPAYGQQLALRNPA